MKQNLENLIQASIHSLMDDGKLPAELKPNIVIERARDKKFGDFASNIALSLAKQAKLSPRDLATLIINALPENDVVKQADIAGPGFINFFVNEAAKSSIVATILSKQASFGESELGQGKKVILEFVSANPTGPLHVGHGRGAAFGSSLANILSAAGFDVTREYYVNDAGRQMNILAVSVWLRYLALSGLTFDFPVNAYQGGYVIDMARALQAKFPERYLCCVDALTDALPKDESSGGDKEIYIDAVIERAIKLLGQAKFDVIHQYATQSILEDIKKDLSEFRLDYESWYSEKSLFESGALEKGIQALVDGGYTYEQEGALWFRATDFADEKDRVLRRANGITTYFASDVAYHWDKFERGFEKVIDIFGADHHGYVARVKAAATAIGKDASMIDVFLVQFAVLYRGEERVQMSTRSGSFVTLRELRDEVGADAARFFYVMRKAEQHMDFDLELAKSQSNDNPVYYVQYAHARVCSVLRQLDEKGMSFDKIIGLAALEQLSEAQEHDLITLLNRYPDVIKSAASKGEPHQLAYYVRELATAFHSYYNACQFIVDDELLRNARLCLSLAVKQVLANGLQLLGVSAPERM